MKTEKSREIRRLEEVEPGMIIEIAGLEWQLGRFAVSQEGKEDAREECLTRLCVAVGPHRHLPAGSVVYLHLDQPVHVVGF